MSVGVGDGSTVAFGTSGFAPELVDITINGLSRAKVDRTHLASTGYKEYLLANILEGVSMDLTIHFDPADTIPFGPGQDFETITVTFPDSETLSFSGAISDVNNIKMAITEIMTATITVISTGEPTATWL